MARLLGAPVALALLLACGSTQPASDPPSSGPVFFVGQPTAGERPRGEQAVCDLDTVADVENDGADVRARIFLVGTGTGREVHLISEPFDVPGGQTVHVESEYVVACGLTRWDWTLEIADGNGGWAEADTTCSGDC